MLDMKKVVGGIVQYRSFINGNFVESRSSEWIDVENPANGKVFAQISTGTLNDVDQVMEAANSAFQSWSKLPVKERAGYVRRLADLVLKNRDHLARVVVQEQGKPLQEALGEIDATAMFLNYAAEGATRIEGDIVPADNANEAILIQRIPYGVAVCLTAWNYPSALVGRKIGPALVAGNAVVVKGHEMTPLSALELARLSQEAGFPPGIFNVVIGTGRTIGDALVSHPFTRLVTMTGSVRAGKEISRNAADHLKVLRLELGGKAPFIVMGDADLDKAVEAAVVSRFTNCGQICTCNERMYVHQLAYDSFINRFLEAVFKLKVGNPLENVNMGPKISEAELNKVHSLVEDARQQGAKLLTGGKRIEQGELASGYFYEPTVLETKSNELTIMQQEIFGPVVPVMTFNELEEIQQMANATHYGLSAYIFSNNLRQVMQTIDTMDFGEIYVNRGGGESVQGFHNGHKLSGLGGEDGKYGMEGYLQKRTIYLNYS